MMKKLLLLLFLLPITIYSQANYQQEYQQANELLRNNEFEKGYVKLKDLESKIAKSEALYSTTLESLLGAIEHLEAEFRMKENFNTSLKYGLEALELIKKGKKYIKPETAKLELFMVKNVAISYSGLKKYEEAKTYKKLLYKAYKKKTLPKELNECFNFDYFKWEDKNVWGYEWYNNDISNTAKIIYYVYSTNPDGSNNEQIVALNVNRSARDTKGYHYIMPDLLNKANSSDNNHSLSKIYTYEKGIDYQKLNSDVKTILKTYYQPQEPEKIPVKTGRR